MVRNDELIFREMHEKIVQGRFLGSSRLGIRSPWNAGDRRVRQATEEVSGWALSRG